MCITIPVQDLAIYNDQTHCWEIEPGPYRIWVGSSSRDLRLDGTVTIQAPGGDKAAGSAPEK